MSSTKFERRRKNALTHRHEKGSKKNNIVYIFQVFVNVPLVTKAFSMHYLCVGRLESPKYTYIGSTRKTKSKASEYI